MLKNLALTLTVLLVGLFGFDLALGHFFVLEPAPAKGMYAPDDEIGFKLTPGYSGHNPSRGPWALNQINSRGFRGPEWAEDQRPRVLFAGDSFTFGLPLEYEQGFVAKVGRKLPAIQAINLGVPSYGPVQIAKTIERTCSGLKPLHVFYMYFQNDTRIDNVTADWNAVVDGYLVTRRTANGEALTDEQIRERMGARLGETWRLRDSLTLKGFRAFLSERGLHPTQLAERWRRKEGGAQDGFARYLVSALKDDGGYSERSVGLARDYILQMAATAKACSAAFTMVVLPSHYEAYYQLREPATERLLALLGNAVDVLDIRDFARPGQSLIQWYDPHYSDAGTDLVSDVVAGYLAGRYGFKTGVGRK